MAGRDAQKRQATGSVGLAALEGYRPRRMDPEAWRAWRDQVVALAGAAFPDNASLARALAGDLCEVIEVSQAAPGTPLGGLLSEQHVRLVAHHRAVRRMAASSVNAGTFRLRTAQGAALDLPARGAALPRSTMFRHRLPILRELARSCDPWLAAAASRLLGALAGPAGIPADCPLPPADFKRFARKARDLGHDRWRWRWRELRAEAIRQAFSEPASVMDVLARLRLDPDALAVAGGVDWRDEIRDVSAVRGSGNVDPAPRWEVTTAQMSDTATPGPGRASRRRPSKAQARRQTAALIDAHRSVAPPLEPRLEHVLATWAPRADLLDAASWLAVRDLAHEVMRRAPFRGEENFTKALRALAAYLGWCHAAGYEMAIDAVLTSTAINDYTRRGLSGYGASSAAKKRSQLLSIARDASLSPDAPVKGMQIPHWAVKPPYLEREVRAFLRRIELVTDPRQRATLQAAVALGLGAGLDTRDIAAMTRASITDVGAAGICVDVPGDRPRRVWVRAQYEELLRRGIEHLARNEPILGRRMHKDTITDLYKGVQPVGNGPRIQQGRLRNTWIATLMTEPVPLWTILSAAGLSGARTLTDIAQFLAPAGDEHRTRGTA